MPQFTDPTIEKQLKAAYDDVKHEAYQLSELMKAPGSVLAFRAWVLSMPTSTTDGTLPSNRTHIEVDELINQAGMETIINHYTMTETPPGVAANFSARVVGMVQVSEAVIGQAKVLNEAKDRLRAVESAIPEGSRRKLRLRLLPKKHHMTYLLRKVTHTDVPLERLTFLWESKMFSQYVISSERAREIVEQSRMLHIPPGKEEVVRSIELQKIGNLGDNDQLVLRKPCAPSIACNAKLATGAYKKYRLSTPLMTTCELPEVIGPGHYIKSSLKERKERSTKPEYTPFIEGLGLWLKREKLQANA